MRNLILRRSQYALSSLLVLAAKLHKLPVQRFHGASMVLCLSLCLTACGPTVTIHNPDRGNTTVSPIAFLPLSSKVDLPKERSQKIWEAVYQELRNAGYLVLDPAIVARACPTGCSRGSPEATAIPNIAQTYGLSAIARLELKTAYHTNFLLGYYNTIEGTLFVETPDLLEKQRSIYDRMKFVVGTSSKYRG